MSDAAILLRAQDAGLVSDNALDLRGVWHLDAVTAAARLRMRMGAGNGG